MPKRNGEKGEMAAASSYAWPSVLVYRGATVAKRRTIVKCDWSDNFGALLKKLGHVLYVLCVTSHPFIMIFIGVGTMGALGAGAPLYFKVYTLCLNYIIKVLS